MRFVAHARSPRTSWSSRPARSPVSPVTAMSSTGWSCGPRRADDPDRPTRARRPNRSTCCRPARTFARKVHEYGGGAWWVEDGTVWYVEWSDQWLWRLEPGADPVAVTPESPEGGSVRWADGDVHPVDGRIALVRETHPPGVAGRCRRGQRDRRTRLPGPAGHGRLRPGLRLRRALVARRWLAGLAGVEPPGDAVGRIDAEGPERHGFGHRGGWRGRARRGHLSAPVGARRVAVVLHRPRGLVGAPPLDA